MNENIFKLSDFEMIIISMKITWQQEMRTTANKFNKLSNEVNKENDVNCEDCFLQQ